MNPHDTQSGICMGCDKYRQSLKPSPWVGNKHLRCGACRGFEYDEAKAEAELDKAIERGYW